MEFMNKINGGFQTSKRDLTGFKSNRSVVTGAPYSYKEKKPPLSAIKPWALSKGLNLMQFKLLYIERYIRFIFLNLPLMKSLVDVRLYNRNKKQIHY
jgi:hypothetical protein